MRPINASCLFEFPSFYTFWPLLLFLLLLPDGVWSCAGKSLLTFPGSQWQQPCSHSAQCHTQCTLCTVKISQHCTSTTHNTSLSCYAAQVTLKELHSASYALHSAQAWPMACGGQGTQITRSWRTQDTRV